MLFSFLHPGFIVPFIIKLPGDGGRFGFVLPIISKGVAFLGNRTTEAVDMIFINFAFSYSGYETFPYTTFVPTRMKKMCFGIPIIKVSDD